MNIILTEKPSQAQDIASGLGTAKKENGYFKVDDYFVTWAFGHLFTIDDSEYRNQKWNLEELPLLPDDFKYKVGEGKENQVKIIHSLIEKASKLIVATDAGREGELIAREILVTFKGKLPPMFRFWTSEALTAEVVKKCIGNIKPLAEYDSLFYSAKARQISDWIIGVNLTRLFSIKGNSLWSVGRVQTPSLAIIVGRDIEIQNFKPLPYSNINVELEKDNIKFIAKLNKLVEEKHTDKLTEEEAKEYFETLQNAKNCLVTAVTKEEKRKLPPPLYSLTLLQRAANRKFGFSAKETLEIAQSLYETHKCISYPRTESRHLADSTKDMVRDLLNKFSPDLVSKVDEVGKRVFDDTKLSDHHAILPLDEYKGDNEKETKIYNIIKLCFIASFMDDYVFENTKVVLQAENLSLPLLASGNSVISLGWEELYKGENASENTNMLPELNENDNIGIVSVKSDKLFTKPKAYITEDTLLGFMEKLNLGTPATRDSIIEKLLSTNYIVREKKNLRATPKGTELVQKLEGSDVADPEMTSNWENELDTIYKKDLGEQGLNEFIKKIQGFTSKEIEKFKEIVVENHNEATPKMVALAKKLAKENKVKDFNSKDTSFEYIKKFISTELEKAKETTPCPCGKGNITTSPKAWNCDGCKVVIWKEVAGKKLTFEQALALFKGETISVKGFKSKKTKKSFDASLKVEEGKVIFVF